MWEVLVIRRLGGTSSAKPFAFGHFYYENDQ